MKSIVFAVTNDLTHDRRMHRICTGLTDAGYRCTLVGRQRKGSKDLAQHSFAQRRLDCFFEKGKFFYIEYNLRLLFYLLLSPTEVICAIDADTLGACTIAAKLRGKQLIYDAHEYFSEVPEVVGRPIVKKIWEWVEDVCIPRCDLCYTVGTALADVFEKKHGKRFEVVRNIPELKEGKIFSVAAEKFILYQGALNEGRGLEELLHAMRRLTLRLKIGGEGDISRALRDMAISLGVDSRVDFLGWVAPKDLEALTAQAFIGYNLLENRGLSYYYSLSNKFFDYIHAGIPSLSSPFPEYQSINAMHEVTLLTNLSETEIVSNIERLQKDGALYNYLKDNCVKARLELNWQQEEKELKRIYAGIA